jgi:hypothetical protein
MSARDVLNHGVFLGERIVAAADVPEAPPALAADGQSIVAVFTSGITVTPPFVLCIAELEGGTDPLADLHAYAYFPHNTALLSSWQRVRTAVANGDTLTYVPLPTLGASRFHVIVHNIDGAPTSVRMMFRGVSAEALDLLHLVETEFRPVNGRGGKAPIVGGASYRIGPLQLDRAYHYFGTAVAFEARGGAGIVATSNDFPLASGMVYEYTPRRVSQQYISFLAEEDMVVYWGQAT